MLLRPFLLPFLLLVGVGMAVLVGVGRNTQSRLLVTDSQTRLILLSLLGGDLSAMENGQRGFLITGNPEFLTPFTDGQAAYQAHVFALEDLSATPQQRANLQRVEELVARWRQEEAEPEIEARRTSAERATALVSERGSRGLLEVARGILSTMQGDENTRLSQAVVSSQDTLNRVRWLTFSGLGLSMLLILLTAWQVARSVSSSLENVAESAREIAAGQYHRRLPPTPVQELAALGRQFDLMAGAVQQREQELRVANDKLERSNRELEQFAYVASHDLQEPLRTIGSYTELLARRYQGRLDERADQYIAFTTAATARMKALIQDLLAYSRVRQGQRPVGSVDTRTLVQGVLSDLEAQVQGSGAQVEVGPLPTVPGNADLLRHVFQNLIGNALKFHAPERPPRVRISATGEDRRWVFHVQDNGIGIEPQYHERILGVFQRLHPMNEFQGSGIGLAVARSAVEQQGGQLWLESVPGQGSVFHFSLPEVPLDPLPADPGPVDPEPTDPDAPGSRWSLSGSLGAGPFQSDLRQSDPQPPATRPGGSPDQDATAATPQPSGPEETP
ncbi:histidine kinase [Deinococcus koreensis]|uniref:histidine kinase n=2 Tax=Deinococcus koreensis TaxID=2054903 RepID=A0A2K3V2I5_9DEIO|nr:histidine kinase [Deinococcus koreensis]